MRHNLILEKKRKFLTQSYVISKIVIALYYCKLSVNSLAMITEFL